MRKNSDGKREEGNKTPSSRRSGAAGEVWHGCKGLVWSGLRLGHDEIPRSWRLGRGELPLPGSRTCRTFFFSIFTAQFYLSTTFFHFLKTIFNFFCIKFVALSKMFWKIYLKSFFFRKRQKNLKRKESCRKNILSKYLLSKIFNGSFLKVFIFWWFFIINRKFFFVVFGVKKIDRQIWSGQATAILPDPFQSGHHYKCKTQTTTEQLTTPRNGSPSTVNFWTKKHMLLSTAKRERHLFKVDFSHVYLHLQATSQTWNMTRNLHY